MNNEQKKLYPLLKELGFELKYAFNNAKYVGFRSTEEKTTVWMLDTSKLNKLIDSEKFIDNLKLKGKL